MHYSFKTICKLLGALTSLRGISMFIVERLLEDLSSRHEVTIKEHPNKKINEIHIEYQHKLCSVKPDSFVTMEDKAVVCKLQQSSQRISEKVVITLWGAQWQRSCSVSACVYLYIVCLRQSVSSWQFHMHRIEDINKVFPPRGEMKRNFTILIYMETSQIYDAAMLYSFNAVQNVP